MIYLFLPMEPVPPKKFKIFVVKNWERLRRDSAAVVGSDDDADLLYSLVLTDVATRWTLVEWARTFMGHHDTAQRCLYRCFSRRAEDWLSQPTTITDITVWSPADPDDDQYEKRFPNIISSEMDNTTIHRRKESTAIRIAPFFQRTITDEVFQEMDITIAWLHAYTHHCRGRLIAAFMGIGIIFFLLLWTTSAFTSP